ncbi:MAG: Biopolymer transport protein ExbD [Candidatus Accumulibacter regalis]|jgi:biopolymer transport protein TolR|uniref:Biopolymer transport protein ExbD n=1 Tax=Accumulibacter regalis TaxID=522306 RepID=A0A011NWD5_ACCRE|nr:MULTISPECIES: protein TolR [unclassified Candidatus Accumulibacter]EXI86993.1 MAG: Biopolymer transport protein ExbD [Candidatus Accumulibacter regalis]MQM33368.1 protein TolR [Candidatus Accumulibacter phosphatis]MBL8366421.1 protein TolR [Accumulibacter sp.]MBN8514757.1 protein TolR [Accumulibacter sp.]MBO3702550.1 protein TolR [Accumulibacter sp.]
MRPRRLKNEINVVPYIDVMLVLLVIFMVTAPMMTTASIDVPSVGKAAQPPADALQVNIRADGKLTLLAPGAGERPVTSGQLPGEIRAAQESNPELAVVIVGDRSVKYEAVLKVMDELQRNEVKRIGLLVQLADK